MFPSNFVEVMEAEEAEKQSTVVLMFLFGTYIDELNILPDCFVEMSESYTLNSVACPSDCYEHWKFLFVGLLLCFCPCLSVCLVRKIT